MLPRSDKIRTSKTASQVDQGLETYEAAFEACGVAWTQMMDAGLQAVKSSDALSRTQQEEVRIAETPADEVFKIDKVRVFRYRPIAKANAKLPPVLICYGLFGRQTMIDLQEDRSLVRNMLADGMDVYVVDWGNPTRADQYLTLDDYIDLYLRSCVEHVVGANGGKPINLFGICEGGTFAVALAALEPQLISGLALAITPVDFDGEPEKFWPGEGFLNTWIKNLDEDDIDLLIGTFGMLPGLMTGAVFSSLTPINSMTKYNLGLARMEGNEAAILNFLRMEKWIADRPDHPGAAARQWLVNLYQRNELARGEFEVAGRRVDLKNIACPVLNIYAEQDHIVPVSCSKALSRFVKPNLYEEIGFPGGHVGVFVSRKAQGVVAGGISKWVHRICDKRTAKKPSGSAKRATKPKSAKQSR